MRELTKSDCASVLIVAITPRLEGGAIDVEGAARNVRYLIDAGADFIMPMCGTGLVYDATLEEYETTVGAFVDAAAGQALIVPGIGPGFGRSHRNGPYRPRTRRGGGDGDARRWSGLGQWG